MRRENLTPLVLLEGRTNVENPGLPSHELFLQSERILDSESEQTFYNCFANLPTLIADQFGAATKSALVVSGGNGIAARNLLSLPHVKDITVLESFQTVTDMAKNELKLRIYNLDSLKHPKVETVNAGYLDWARSSKNSFDLILIENTGEGAKQIYVEYVALLKNSLAENGILAVRGGKLSDADLKDQKLDFVSAAIASTLRTADLSTDFVYEPTQSQAIVLAWKNQNYSLKKVARRLGLYSSRKVKTACVYSENWTLPPANASFVSQRTVVLKDLDLFSRELALGSALY